MLSMRAARPTRRARSQTMHADAIPAIVHALFGRLARIGEGIAMKQAGVQIRTLVPPEDRTRNDDGVG